MLKRILHSKSKYIKGACYIRTQVFQVPDVNFTIICVKHAIKWIKSKKKPKTIH